MSQRILLMSSARNGLTVRAELALRGHGHHVRTAVVADASAMDDAVADEDFDVIICPFLTAAIPARIYEHHRVVIIHPGPVGDRGPSSLDWALTEGRTRWGVTAIGAVAEMDAGPVWAWRAVEVQYPQRKSTLYNTAIADAAIECILETATHAEDPAFVPVDQADAPRPVPDARTRAPVRQLDRHVPWTAPAATILARIHAADGAPGWCAEFAGHTVHLYDAHPGRSGVRAEPGTIIGRRHHGIEIACGAQETIWVGHLRARSQNATTCKGPAASVLARLGVDLDSVPVREEFDSHDIVYRRDGAVGTLTVTAYNGALTTGQCDRLAAAVRAASEQDTDVLVLRGGVGHFFLTGIHLGAIELAPDPALEGWENIKAINRVCRALWDSPQVTIAAITGNAGAGGVALPLAADVVVARRRATLSPAYRPMGLTGSELHTVTLPHRVGPQTAETLLERGDALDTTTAREIGLLDGIGPDDNSEFDYWLDRLSRRYTEPHVYRETLRRNAGRRSELTQPLDAYEAAELVDMAEDLFADRHGFGKHRQEFLKVSAALPTLPRAHALVGHRP
ncbi:MULTISPECIES: enoyl-CoA hydratase-related protein [Nocardia]|uniref:enoyl-CoA hydratase-related protein n=1 Tax=Nocardia TaxID=1817 RepID=UPI0018E57C6B|nr:MULTISPECIES: enoyl-CoA hydratase-related protein [Nocardia]